MAEKSWELDGGGRGALGYHPAVRPKPNPSQRWRVVLAMVLFASFFLLDRIPSLLCGPFGTCGNVTAQEQARKVLTENPLIDGHNDLLILIRSQFQNKLYSNFTKLWDGGGLAGQVDAPRIKTGQYSGAFWSAFLPCPANASLGFEDANYAATVRATLEQIDTFHRLAELYPDTFTLSRTAAEAEQAFKEGRTISPLIIEGLHQIGNSLATLRLYHQLGVRYATLSWNCHNKYVDAALVADSTGETVASKPLWKGLSPAGIELIREMNRLGMIVDLAHVSKDTMLDVLGGNPSKTNGSLAPPIFSHSSVYALCPHPRNVPDDVLELVRSRNSLVMINFNPEFISCHASDAPSGLPQFVPENNTLQQVVRHVMYVGEKIGYDHVGIGSDFDGISDVPRGLEDVSKFPDLVAALLEAGVTEENAGKIVGRNLLRVWAEVDRVSAELRKTMKPIEDDIRA